MTQNIIIPFEIKIYIFEFLTYKDIAKLDHGRIIFYKLSKHIYVPQKYKYGAFNNMLNKCFYCPTDLGCNYNINLCDCISIMKDLDLEFKFPSVCFKCTKTTKRGEQSRIMCKCCGKYTIHLGLDICS